MVATDVGDRARIVSPHGAVVPPGDAAALAEALGAAGDAVSGGARRNPGARQAVIDRFGGEAAVLKTEKALLEAI